MYLANPAAKAIWGFAVGQSSGSLTPLASSPTTVTGLPVAIAIDSQARFALVGMRYGPEALVTYAIDAQTGTLTAVPSSGLAQPISPEDYGTSCPTGRLFLSSIVLHPSGRFAYVVFDGAECICGVEAWLFTYAVDATSGRLTKLDRPPVDLGRAGQGDAPPRGLSVVSAVSERDLYVANRGVHRGGIEGCDVASSLTGFSVDLGSSGALRALEGAPFAEGIPNNNTGFRWLALRPAGDLLYLARDQDTLQLRRDVDTGALTPLGASPLVGPMAFSPAGRLYSAASLGDVSGLQVFEVQPDTGSLMPKAQSFSATQGAVSAIAIDSSGRFLYAVQSEGRVVSAFRIDAATGLLQPAPGLPTIVGAEPTSGYDFRVIAIANVP